MKPNMYTDEAVGKDADGADVRFGYYALGFYDLLGQQKSLEVLRSLPDGPEEHERFVQAAKATAGTVSQVRKLLREFVESFASPVDESQFPPNATPQAIAKYRQFRDVPLHMQCFADTCLMYYAFPEGEPSYGLRNLFGLVVGMGISHLLFLASRVPGRGSIEVDIGCDYLPGEVYGPVLSRAHRLESKIAKYPRIVVGEGARQFCTTMCERCGGEVEASLARESGKAVLSAFSRDKDGETIVHYLGPLFRKMAKQEPRLETSQAVAKAHAFVNAEADRFRDDEVLGPSYAQLAEYFAIHAPAWR